MTKAILDRQSRAGLGILIALGVQGCVFRLHDPGLMESSAEAGRVIAEVREPAGSAFSAMEANLAAVSSSGEKLTALENDLEQVTFLRVLPDLTSEEILERLTESVDEHLSAGDSIARGVKEATRSIESELVRQKLLEPTDPRDLASLAKKANERWADLLGIADKVGLDASDSELKEAIGSVLGAPADDPRVKDAKVLLTQVVSDVARADAARMEELRRYAKAVELIQSDWKERTENWTATLAIVAPLVDPQEYKVLRGRLQIVETCARVQPNRASPEACQALLENLEESQKCEGSVDPQVAQDIFSEFSQAVEDLADWGGPPGEIRTQLDR
jgi:hypothetical protein